MDIDFSKLSESLEHYSVIAKSIHSQKDPDEKKRLIRSLEKEVLDAGGSLKEFNKALEVEEKRKTIVKEIHGCYIPLSKFQGRSIIDLTMAIRDKEKEAYKKDEYFDVVVEFDDDGYGVSIIRFKGVRMETDKECQDRMEQEEIDEERKQYDAMEQHEKDEREFERLKKKLGK